MAYEIEFLPVGDASKGGDAIVIRYTVEGGYELMLIDGGHAQTGEEIVTHLRTWFGKDVRLAHVLLTHSDADHASGLREVLKNIPVSNLWLHIPWLHAEDALPLFEYNHWTTDALAKKIKGEYDIIAEIVDLAWNSSKIYEPFQGAKVGPFTVLSPHKDAYTYLMPQFDRTPNPDQKIIEAAGFWIGKQSFLQKLIEKAVTKAQTWVTETWVKERLKDGGNAGPSNETSVVLYGQIDDQNILLTGDAGVWALTWSTNYAAHIGLPLQKFAFVQIPHHGSRSNVGPTILNRLLGPILPEGSQPTFTAFVSAPKDDATHPRKMVLNAFLRRGAKIATTQGSSALHRVGYPRRDGYKSAEIVAFSPQVEEYD